MTTIKKIAFILISIGVLLGALSDVSFGQDIEQVVQEKPVRVSGGFNANSTLYHVSGMENRRDPFFWMLSANINFDIYGVLSIPFSFTISQQNKNFAQPQPFNQFGLSPKYKAVTLHLGHRSMNFSDYTLAGNLFFGAGVEVEPKDAFWRVSAMYGQFAKPVAKSAQEGLVFADPTFRRTGFGVKLGLGREKNNLDLILFRARDDEHSIQIADSLEVRPEENLVLGFNTNHKIGRRLSFQLEYAYSMYTRDTRLHPVVIDDFTFVNNLGSLFTPNLSSDYNSAIKSKIQYNANAYQLNLSYRRIDPGYQTMGSSFLNNDLRDISGGVAWGMFKQKVNIALNAGIQTNNLNNQLTADVARVIFSSNVNYIASEKFNVNVNYSNFNSSTKQSQLQTDILVDSLEFFQLTRSGTVNLTYQTNREIGLNHSLFLSTTLQDASDSENTSSTFFNVTAGHQMRIGQGWSVGLSYTYNKSQSLDISNVTTGPILTLGRSFFSDRVRSTWSASLLNTYLDGNLESLVSNLRWVNSCRIGKKHNVSLNVYYLNKNLKAEDATVINEIRGGINYSYRL